MSEKALPMGDKSPMADGAWLRLLFERANDAIFIENEDDEILDANERACQLLGYSREELLRMRVPDLQAPKVRGQAVRSELARGGQVFEGVGLHRDGTRIPVEISATCISGGIVLSIVRDITHRKQAEDALRENEECYRMLVENHGEGMSTIDADERFVFVNPAGHDIFGVPPGSLAGRSLKEFTDERNYAIIQAQTELRRAGQSSVYEFDIVRPDGHKRNLLIMASPQFDRQGQFVGAFGVFRDITERKRTEKALRQSEERYRRLLESVTNYVYTVEVQDGRPVATVHGQGCAAVTGYEPEDYVAKAYLWHEMVHDEDKAAVVGQASQILAGQEAFSLEHRIIHKDGSIRWVRNTPVPRYSADGRLVAYDGLITDITERKRAEEALRSESNFVSAVLDTVGALVVVLDRQGRIIRFNRTCEQLTGYSLSEVGGRLLWDLFGIPEEVAALRAVFDSMQAGQVPSQYENYWLARDGSTRLIAWSNSVLLDAGGQVEYIIGTGLDITERKLAEAALRESEEKYRTAVEVAIDAIFVETLDGRILDCNTSACKMYGYSKDELLKLTVTQLMPPEVAAILPDVISEESARGGIFIVTLNKRKDGTVFPCEVNTRLIMVGQERRVIAYVHDITDRKQAEDALRQAHDDLELRVQDRTAELASAVGQLRREIEERQRAEEALERRATQLAIINDIGRKIAAALELDEVLNRTTRLFQERFDYHHVGVFVVEAERGVAILKAAGGSYDISFPKEHRLRLEEGMVGWTAAHGERRLSNDVITDPYYVPSFSVTRSELCVPIRMAGKTIGVLDVQSPHPNGFDKSDILVMETLADQVAVAMENARLFEQAQREIAERRQAEEALRQRNEELTAYNAIAATISQSLDLEHILNATLDTVLEVIAIEAGWIQLLDEAHGELLKLAVQRGFSPEMSKVVEFIKLGEGITGQVAQTGRPIVVTNAAQDPRLELKSPDCAILRALVVVPIKSKDNVLGVLGVISRSVRQLSPRQVQLLTTVGNQLGVAIENVRLVRQTAEIELLRELDRFRSELLANISHELRTPLGLIKVFCTTLLRQDANFDAATQREFLGDIEEETDKLEELVDNLLDLSRMQRGQLRLDKRPTDLGQLARKVMKAIEIQIAQPDGRTAMHSGYPYRLVYDFVPEPLVALVDSRLVEQVLRNLLSNAIKYSPEGGCITLRGWEEENQLIIQVNDQGVGIPAADLEHVFERFYRVNNEITQSVRGAGLGLPVCKGIVGAHGGRIWVESVPGVGSTFYFSLPKGQVGPVGEELEGA